MDDLKLQTMLNVLVGQRESALNSLANIAGDLAQCQEDLKKAQERIAELEQK